MSLSRPPWVAVLLVLGWHSAAAADTPAPPALDATAVARQAALDRAGFSPGLIDGKIGRKTQIALRAFQAFHKLTDSGEFDAATQAALSLAQTPALRTYHVTVADRAQVGGPIPKDWNVRAKLKRCRYESLSALLAERGHCTQATLRALNPGRALDHLRPGEAVVIPNVHQQKLSFDPQRIEINLSEKVLRVFDEAERVAALFHCSIAELPEKRPKGQTSVTVIVFDPEYAFKPEMWPEVTNVERTLYIAPGPRNPVGLCWIGLARPGYGIHGTPYPELIGKTGSHGCIRLANWDALRLGGSIEVGLPVQFVGE